MGWGGTGYRGWPAAASAVTPDELNSVYTHGQFWIPAGALTPNETEPMVIEDYQSSGSAEGPTYTVAKCLPSVDSQASFTWAFKSDFAAVPSVDFLLKVAPLWFAKTTASAPANVIAFDVSAANLLIGTTLNQPHISEFGMDQIVPATAYDLQGGKTADVQATIGITVQIDALSASDWNFLAFSVERDGARPEDTFLGDIFILGYGVQWAIDFNNVAVWPT